MIHGLRFRRFGFTGVTAVAILVGLSQPEAITSPVHADDTELTSADTNIDAAVLSLQGMITDVMVDSLRRRFEEAQASGAKVIILDMDTPGGLVTSSIAIADLVRELTDIKTVAWVNPNAHSGGSLVAVACDEIVMTRSSRIGDSQVIMGGPGGAGAVPEELQAKAYTPVLADFRTSAKLNGYSHVLCESFVLPDSEVWWIEHIENGERKFVLRDKKIRLVGEEPDSAPRHKKDKDAEPEENEDTDTRVAKVQDNPPDEPHEWRLVKTYYDPILEREIDTIQPVVPDNQLLEMSPGEAHAYGFNKAVITSTDELKQHYGLTSVRRFDPTWSESLAYWMTSMYVRGFLMVIIMLGAYVEFHTPGVGVPGLTALICLAIFVGAPYLAGLANVWEILLIVLGIALMSLEVFVIPGFGVAGVSGIALVIVGLLATFVPEEPGRTFPLFFPSLPQTVRYMQNGMMTLVASLVASLAGMVLLSRYLPKTPFFRRLVPANPAPSDVLVDDPYRGAARVGDIGETEGILRPSGKARFDGVLVDVVSQGEFVDPHVRVEVIERRGNRVVVRPTSG